LHLLELGTEQSLVDQDAVDVSATSRLQKCGIWVVIFLHPPNMPRIELLLPKEV
jgi:hypothetical protein